MFRPPRPLFLFVSLEVAVVSLSEMQHHTTQHACATAVGVVAVMAAMAHAFV